LEGESTENNNGMGVGTEVKRNEEERDYLGIGIHRLAVIGSCAALPLSLIRIYYSNQMF